MNSRLLTALVAAPIAGGLVLGAWFMWGLERAAEPPSLRFLFFGIFAGMMYGALFEVFVLLPLLVILRRLNKASRGALIVYGIVIWTAGVGIQTWATVEPSLTQLTMSELAMFILPLLPILVPGLVLVLVFAFVAQGGRAA